MLSLRRLGCEAQHKTSKGAYKAGKRWKAEYGSEGKTLHLGRYGTEEEALRA